MDDKTEKIVAAVQCKPRRPKHDWFSTYDYFCVVANLLAVLADTGNGLDDDDRHNLVEETTNVLYIVRTGEEV